MDWSPDERPSAKQIAAKYRTDIAEGRYGPGAKLPGAKGLSAKLRVGIMTVQSAYKQLAEDGLVDIRQGSGTYVRDPQKGEPTAQETAVSLRELRVRLDQVSEQLQALSERVAELEGSAESD